MLRFRFTVTFQKIKKLHKIRKRKIKQFAGEIQNYLQIFQKKKERKKKPVGLLVFPKLLELKVEKGKRKRGKKNIEMGRRSLKNKTLVYYYYYLYYLFIYYYYNNNNQKKLKN